MFLPNQLISRLNYSIHRGLKDAEIVIPYPQRDLHIKSSKVLFGEPKEPLTR